MQVQPIKSQLKAPAPKRLKLEYDEPLSKLAFKSSLRRYIEVPLSMSVLPPSRRIFLPTSRGKCPGASRRVDGKVP